MCTVQFSGVEKAIVISYGHALFIYVHETVMCVYSAVQFSVRCTSVYGSVDSTKIQLR